jgi:hypothetical protein
MDRKTLFTLIIAAGVLVSLAGIYQYAVNNSDMIGAGIFFLQGAVFLLYYSLMIGKMKSK